MVSFEDLLTLPIYITFGLLVLLPILLLIVQKTINPSVQAGEGVSKSGILIAKDILRRKKINLAHCIILIIYNLLALGGFAYWFMKLKNCENNFSVFCPTLNCCETDSA